MQARAEVIKQSIDIAQFIESKGIKLKKQGKSLVGICPFHKDTKPSFTVTPEENLWHCFGCGKGGDVFSFLQEFSGISFPEALQELKKKNGKKSLSNSAKEPENTDSPALNPQEILNRVVEYYHETFYEDTRGIEYLRDKRNIHGKEIYESFKVGFANGHIFNMIPESGEVLDALKKIGIITAKDKEFFYNCCIFPIYDESGQVTEIYGRSIEEGCSNPHLYLKGPHNGVFNFQAAKRSRELLLTEGIIDAISIYEAGYKDVIPLYGVNGLTSSHTSLFRKYGVEKIFCVFDNDAAGCDACKTVAKALSFIECFKVTLPCKDANDFFQTRNAGDFAVLLTQAEKIAPEHCESRYDKEKQDDGFTLYFDNISYRIKIVPAFDDRLRLTLKALCDGKIFLDTIEFFSHRSRQSAINQISKRFSLLKEKVESHFVNIMTEIEKYEEEKSRRDEEKTNPVSVTLSESDKVEAQAFLRSPDMAEQIMTDMDILGYVGEPSNKLLSYLVGISRKLDRPLSVIISSSSGSGKSRLAEVVESLTPPEDVILFSRLSPQALGYMEKDFLKRKLLIIEERCGSEAADYSIRTLQSRRKLTQGVVIKDPASGRMHTKTYTVEGPIAYIETTTSGSINPENSTRCFEIYLDETKQQTENVQKTQRCLKTLEGLLKGENAGSVIKKHQNAQRLLKSVKVVIPYAPFLTFPSEWLRTRRDNERFLSLIEAVCFLHQHQREVKVFDDGERKLEYISATVSDYRLAYHLAGEVLSHTFNDLAKPSKEMLCEIVKMAEFKAIELKKELHEALFSRRDIREYTRWPDRKVKECLSQLEDLEYLNIVSGSKGKTYLYHLPEGCAYGGFTLNGLMEPSVLQDIMATESG